MKHFAILAGLVVSGIQSVAVAGACLDAGYNQGPLTVAQINNQLSGRQVLAMAPGGEEWNEDHCDSGALYKVGTTEGPPKHPDRPSVDPRAFRGTWTARAGGETNPPRITYQYTVGGSSTFTWTLWRNTSNNDLCWEDLAGTPIVATGAKPTTPAGSPCGIPSSP